jgi:hypothetical protein
MAAIDAAGKWIFGGLVGLFDFFKDPVTGLFNIGKGLLSFLFGTFDATKTFLQNLITALLGNANATLTAASDFIKTLVTRMIYWITHPQDAFGMIAAVVNGLFKTTFDNTKGFLDNLIKAIFGSFTNGLDFLGHLFKSIFGSFTQGLDFVGHLLSDGVNFFNTLLSKLVDQIVGAILGPNAVKEWNSLTKWASGLLNFDNIYQTIQDIWYKLTHFLPVVDTTTSTVNLITQGSFKTASTLSAASGWTWDSNTNNTSTGSITGSGVGGSAKVTAAGANRYLYCNQVIPVQDGDTLTFSAYVKTDSLSRSGSATPFSLLVFPGSSTTGTAVTATGTWPLAPTTFTKISGTYTVSGVTSVRVAIGITSAALTGSVWFDDVFLGNTRNLQQPLVKDLTGAFGGVKDALGRSGRGTTPTTTMDYNSFFDATTATTGLIGTIGTTADGAKSNLQTVVDGIANTVGGSTGAVNQSHTTVSTNFQNFFGKLYGTGVTKPQDTVPQGSITDMTSAFSGLTDALYGSTRGTRAAAPASSLSLYNAATSTTGLAGTAKTAADGAAGGVTNIANGLSSTVGGGSTTGSAASTATYFGSFFNKLYGTGVTTPQNYITNDAIINLSTTKLSGTISQGQITDGAVSTAKLASTVVSDIKSQVAAGTVGSGSRLVKTGASSWGVTPTGRNKFALGFFTSNPITSTDITAVMEDSIFQGTYYGTYYNGTFRVTNPGWYMVEVAFRVNTAFTAGFNIAPVLFKDGAVHKVGTDIIQTATRTSRYVQAGWMVYLTANQIVGGGYDAAVGGSQTNWANFFQDDNTGVETYISIALLNRSLA